jgi:hypothetical protein
MKRMILLSLAICFSSGSFAESEDVCKSLSGLSKQIMEIRQYNNPPITDFLAIYENNANYNDSAVEITKGLIIDAYDKPRFTTKKYQTESIKNFSNKVYITCIKSSN